MAATPNTNIKSSGDVPLETLTYLPSNAIVQQQSQPQPPSVPSSTSTGVVMIGIQPQQLQQLKPPQPQPQSLSSPQPVVGSSVVVINAGASSLKVGYVVNPNSSCCDGKMTSIYDEAFHPGLINYGVTANEYAQSIQLLNSVMVLNEWAIIANR